MSLRKFGTKKINNISVPPDEACGDVTRKYMK